MKRLGALVLVSLFAAIVHAADPPTCRVNRIAEWPVRFQAGTPVSEGEINGQKVSVLFDTGSTSSVITRATADRLGLSSRISGNKRTQERILGFGGLSRVGTARVEDLRVGGASAKNVLVYVAGERPLAGVDMVLGEDFFAGNDLEFDYAAGVVRLFQPVDCGDDAVLSYWDHNARVLPMEDARLVIVPIVVNGHEARAIVDSGMPDTVVQLIFAEKLGIKPGEPGVASSSCTSGFGADVVHSWVARFDSVAIGTETIRDAHLRIAEYMAEILYRPRAPPEVILGGDFLGTHRVYISRRQSKMYFTYNGGLVFRATPALDCDDRLRGKSAVEAIAFYDQALKRDPGDSRARLARAMLLLGQHDAAGALRDLDAIVAAEPSNAVALSSRSIARMTLKDYAGALADSDAAIANGMRSPQMYLMRATIRREQGDNAKTLDELDAALRLDPHHVPSLRARAQLLQEIGRPDDAKKDLATLAALRADEAPPAR
jgi:predicted aspartyl protease